MIFATHRKLLVEKMATHIAVMDGGFVTGFYEKNEGLKTSVVKDRLF